jgi:hypothetical protein
MRKLWNWVSLKATWAVVVLATLAVFGMGRYEVLRVVKAGGDIVIVTVKSWSGIVQVPLPRAEAVRFGFVQ